MKLDYSLDDFVAYFGLPEQAEAREEMLLLYQYYPLIQHTELLHQVPAYLAHTGGEFCCAFNFSSAFISDICFHGYLPMATKIAGKTVLLIKLHTERCILDFSNLHISRSVKRRAKELTITMNQSFLPCVHQIVQFHQDDNWLYPELINSFAALQGNQGIVSTVTFEVWFREQMVAGELGYMVGGCYTSLSGFYTQNSAGTIQMCATAQLLKQQGFSFWDLGMEMDYKLALGAHTVSRQVFLERFYASRNEACIVPQDGCTVSQLLA